MVGPRGYRVVLVYKPNPSPKPKARAIMDKTIEREIIILVLRVRGVGGF